MSLVDVASGKDGAVVVTGELDMAGVDFFLSAVSDKLVRGRPITIDLGGLTFIDSTGLQCLLMLSEEYEIVLRKPQPPIMRVLSITDVARWPGIRIEP